MAAAEGTEAFLGACVLRTRGDVAVRVVVLVLGRVLALGEVAVPVWVVAIEGATFVLNTSWVALRGAAVPIWAVFVAFGTGGAAVEFAAVACGVSAVPVCCPRTGALVLGLGAVAVAVTMAALPPAPVGTTAVADGDAAEPVVSSSPVRARRIGKN